MPENQGHQALKALHTNVTPEEKRRSVRGMFNSIAPTYDLLNHLLSMSIDKLWRRSAVSLMHLDRRSVVVDLACGTGDLTLTALKYEPAGIIAIDPAREMLARTAQKTRKFTNQVKILESYGEDLPLANNVCTHAMIAFGIRNVSDRPAVFREIHRLLRPPGIFMVLEFSHWEKGLIGALFRLYFHKILPLAGSIISKDKTAYTYLPESVEKFVSSAVLVQEAAHNGFSLVATRKYFFGVATCYLFQKKI